MDENKDSLDKAFDRIKQSRDELKLKMHLGGKEVQAIHSSRTVRRFMAACLCV